MHNSNELTSLIEAFDEGCASYIVKPVDQDKLVMEMRKLGLI